ncbi:MAG: energy-coupled thiamine transporter ThiT [Clostridia bacterium]|nr:energy-coupled thiamine transporter ThiT [Clostridia bacterium]
MFLFSLLEVSEQATNVVKWISVGAVVLLLGLIALIAAFNKKTRDTKRIAFAGICVCMSFTLAIIKFSPVQYGGSITIASFVPILIYAYVYGPIDGFLVGLIHGLLNFVEDPYILTPATFIFDYLLAFMSIGVMGFFGKMQRKDKGCLPIVLGCVAVFILRFASHLVSGMIFFMENSVWVSLPDWAMGNAFIYSFIYQCIYVPADALIATAVLITLCKTGVLDKIVKTMRPKRKETVAVTEDTENTKNQ